MSGIDYVVLAILASSTLFSFLRGWSQELRSLITWIGTIASTVYLTPYIIRPYAVETLSETVGNPLIAVVIAHVLVFIGSLFTMGALGYLISYSIGYHLSPAFDRMLGLVFGFARGILIVLVCGYLIQLTSINDVINWDHSISAQNLILLIEWAKPILPDMEEVLEQLQKAAPEQAARSISQGHEGAICVV